MPCCACCSVSWCVQLQVWVGAEVCTAAGSLWAAHVLPSPDGVCHPGPGPALLQDVGKAAGCPLHTSAPKVTSPQGCVGTSEAENQGGVSITRPHLTPLSLFGTSLLRLKEVPRQSRSSLPLKVTLSQHHCRFPDSLQATCDIGDELMLEARVLLQPAPGMARPGAETTGTVLTLCWGPALPLPGCTFR